MTIEDLFNWCFRSLLCFIFHLCTFSSLAPFDSNFAALPFLRRRVIPLVEIRKKSFKCIGFLRCGRKHKSEAALLAVGMNLLSLTPLVSLSGVMALVEQVWLVAVCRRSVACYAVERHNSINDYLWSVTFHLQTYQHGDSLAQQTTRRARTCSPAIACFSYGLYLLLCTITAVVIVLNHLAPSAFWKQLKA